MSLTHRVAIATGVFNLGFYGFWSKVYDQLGMQMSNALAIHLRNKDKNMEKKREYQKSLSYKRRRVQKQNDLTKELLNKQIEDQKRGSTYGCGVGLVEIFVPDEVRKEENAIKTILKSKCGLFGCYASGHIRRTSRKCEYHTCASIEEVNAEMDAFMRFKYPKYYHGESLLSRNRILFYFVEKSIF